MRAGGGPASRQHKVYLALTAPAPPTADRSCPPSWRWGMRSTTGAASSCLPAAPTPSSSGQATLRQLPRGQRCPARRRSPGIGPLPGPARHRHRGRAQGRPRCLTRASHGRTPSQRRPRRRATAALPVMRSSFWWPRRRRRRSDCAVLCSWFGGLPAAGRQASVLPIRRLGEAVRFATASARRGCGR
jgi:hypothetical protein